MAKDAITYVKVGTNLEAAADETFVYFRVPKDRARAYGQSASGKTDMVAKTDGGWKDLSADLPSVPGFRVNIQAGFKH